MARNAKKVQCFSSFSYVFLMSKTFLHSTVWARLATGLIVILFACMVSPGAGWASETGLLRLHCTNPASGVSWTVAIDLDHGLVDSIPATITDKWISWPDPKQGIFELERATGKLQFRNASSTGGYFLHYTCRSE
jgi:hypothetical protein